MNKIRLVLLISFMVVGLMGISACSDETPFDSTPSSIVLFPQQKGQTGMEALLKGKLVVTDGTLRIVDSEFNTSYLPIWPNGFKVSLAEDGTIQVLNKNGYVVAKVGEAVIMGGGEVSDTETNRKWLNDEVMKQPLPASATAPFWLVGERVRLDLTNSSDDESNESSQAQDNKPSQGTPDLENIGTPLEGDAALLRQAEAYAADVGIGVEEALRQLKLQDPIGELGAALTENEKETFAGMWIQHEPDYRVIVQFTSNAEETMRRYLQEARWSELSSSVFIEIRTVGVSLIVLDAEQTEAMRICDQLGIAVSSDQDVYTNSVQLYVTDRAPLDAALQKAGISLPDHVNIVVVNNLGEPDSSQE